MVTTLGRAQNNSFQVTESEIGSKSHYVKLLISLIKASYKPSMQSTFVHWLCLCKDKSHNHFQLPEACLSAEAEKVVIWRLGRQGEKSG